MNKRWMCITVMIGLLIQTTVSVRAEEADNNYERLSLTGGETILLGEKENGGHKERIVIDQCSASEAAARMQENTNPNDAWVIQVNSLLNDALTEEGQERWYAFSAGKGKLTLDLDFSASENVDYDMYLYRYDNASGSILLAEKAESADRIEHFAYMAEEGIYFVAVRSYSGYDSENQYTLGVVLSTYYDAQEVDDRAQDAYILEAPQFCVTGTIDNQFDVDVQKYTTPISGKLTIMLENDQSSQNIYQVDMFNANGVRMAELEQGKNYYFDYLPSGTYYFRVYCRSFSGDYRSTYTLSGDVRRTASSVTVTHAGDAEEPISDYIDGPYWRVYGDSYVEGTAYDANGNVVSDADIEIDVTVKSNGQTIPAYGRTDSQGNFRIKLSLGRGVGEYNYYNQGISIHYYDIVEVSFRSNGKEIDANIDHLYHFAYQIMLNNF
ncbi:MAG: Ig-like domain-containing protein [Clostridium sp.]|nr:Ig-like domain-containing protein [Clostridium sp.]